MVRVAALLAAMGALAGFTTSQLLPRRYVSRTTVGFKGSVSKDRCGYAAERTMSAAELAPIVLQSAYYKDELDYKPVEELVQRIRDNGSIVCARIGNRDVFRVEFADADRYAALDMARILTEQMGRNAGDKTVVVDAIRISFRPPGPELCLAMGLSGGMLVGLVVGAIARVSGASPRSHGRNI